MSLLNHLNVPSTELRQAIVLAYHMDETQAVEQLMQALGYDDAIETAVASLANDLVNGVRSQEDKKTAMEAFMAHYDLSTEEGILLMCLAEALLRIPDKKTENLLISDKLSGANWKRHIGLSESSFVNVATWGLALTGKVLKQHQSGNIFQKIWRGLLEKSSEPVVRTAVREAIKVMSHQFVLGRDMSEALKNSQQHLKQGFSYSYDMLGEAARTQHDADKYFESYSLAIDAIGASDKEHKDLFNRPSISVKLSALYPRYEFTHQKQAVAFLTEQLKRLSIKAMKQRICLTVDAEEADRLDISLDIIANVFSDPDLKDWDGLGLAVQAYQKRATAVIHWLVDLAKRENKHMRVRLVKGAYWDSEVKIAQENGYKDYPVFTRKTSTDVSYLACAKLMLKHQDTIYPQFATHNAYTVASILVMLDAYPQCRLEFQHLQGMGEALHRQVLEHKGRVIPSRIYAPVGSHEDLLPYLVRRLLENGANSSFVNQIADSSVPVSELVASPVRFTSSLETVYNPKIPLPKDIYGKSRLNANGIDITDYNELTALDKALQQYAKQQYTAAPMHKVIKQLDDADKVLNPADHSDLVGHVVQASADDIEQSITRAVAVQYDWDQLGPRKRAKILLTIADLIEENRYELMALVSREAGRIMPDVISELREAVDFCRYYAKCAKLHLTPKTLPGYTGEDNTLSMSGCGVMLCISPWNFPLAIFTGQVVAALVAGNCVIAKPSGQTPLIAALLMRLFYQAGVPEAVCQLMPGSGRLIGNTLVKDERIAGIMLTGSTATAKQIQRTLCEREGPIVPLIAETGGINAMIADSSALPEQLVDDVIASAFGSAGQRCSALRLLCVQEEIADRVITMLQGAMQELNLGPASNLTTDVGPVIDASAQKVLQQHIAQMKKSAALIAEVTIPHNKEATFVAPCAFELTSIDQLQREVFGPVLHVVRYNKKDLDQTIDAINKLNYGLTFGIQSRIERSVNEIASKIKAGNIYVNRNMIGAVVGVQPFGGQRLSGTGPKAGGPHYLLRLCHETTVSIDTTAAGGNASLMSLN
jgi:RHH-type transcriptional regulator, proline utilization regulon repressor / proline dehydrogenase / delta 1-pyrroline-5-carboxylate dehydrogenase